MAAQAAVTAMSGIMMSQDISFKQRLVVLGSLASFLESRNPIEEQDKQNRRIT